MYLILPEKQYCHSMASLAGTMMETSKILNVDVLKGIAEKYNKRVASILLRWPLQLGASVIQGSGNPKHSENLEFMTLNYQKKI